MTRNDVTNLIKACIPPAAVIGLIGVLIGVGASVSLKKADKSEIVRIDSLIAQKAEKEKVREVEKRVGRVEARTKESLKKLEDKVETIGKQTWEILQIMQARERREGPPE